MGVGDEAQWRRAIGAHAERYLQHFQRISASGRRWLPGWNTAAFLHSTGWFCYRRMYGWAFLNLFAPWVLLFALLMVGGWVAPRANIDTAAFILLLVYLGCVFVLLPLYADSLYYRHLAPRLTKAKPPSLWTQIAAALFALVYFGLFLLIWMPAYGDYTPRAKVSEAILTASHLRAGVTEFYAEHRRFPDGAEGMRIGGEPVSARVQSVVWDPAQRAIVVTLRDPFPGKRFALRAAEAQGSLSWKCGPIDLDRKHLPSGCRD